MRIVWIYFAKLLPPSSASRHLPVPPTGSAPHRGVRVWPGHTGRHGPDHRRSSVSCREGWRSKPVASTRTPYRERASTSMPPQPVAPPIMPRRRSRPQPQSTESPVPPIPLKRRAAPLSSSRPLGLGSGFIIMRLQCDNEPHVVETGRCQGRKRVRAGSPDGRASRCCPASWSIQSTEQRLRRH